MLTKKFRRTIVLILALCMLLSVSAFADVMGEYLAGYSAAQGAGMTLARGIYWTGSDYRNENYIEYTPNTTVQPMVVYGSKLTNYGSYSSMSSLLASKGYHAVAGINGDYYNMTTFEPIGIVIYEGALISSDSGCNAVGFKADGSAVMGRPYMKSTVTIAGTDFNLPKINKARTDDFSLLTPDYGSTTKSSGDGYNIICTPSADKLSLSCSVTLTVDEVNESTGAVSIPAGKMVLTLPASAAEDKVAAVKALQAGDTIAVSISASPLWNGVQFAVGSYRKLVTDGKVETGLDTTLEPRSAVGMKADGSLVFYTVDGRQSGYSVGATMTQVANRLIEMGCTEATIMDGGGSTSMNAIYLGDESISQINKSSGGTQRSVTNYIVLATKAAATGTASQLALYPLSNNMLVGNTRTYTAKAADENGYAAALPSGVQFSVEGGIGTITADGKFTATAAGNGSITVSAPGVKSASVAVRVIETPGSITVKNQTTGSTVSSLSMKAGASVDLTASASLNHTSFATDDVCFKWAVTDGMGTITADGKYTAADVTADGAITVTAGDKTVSIPLSLFQTGSFDDVRTTNWCYDSVEYVNEKGLITGVGTRQFAPNANISRAMMATVLWRMAGKPAAEASADFSDVEAGTWYTDAVAWAQSTGVVTGYADKTFKPAADISREQMAAMLYRYECWKNAVPQTAGSLSGFPDAGSVSDWALDAVNWCVSQGLLNGMDGSLKPQGTATRAQCAAIIERYSQK